MIKYKYGFSNCILYLLIAFINIVISIYIIVPINKEDFYNSTLNNLQDIWCLSFLIVIFAFILLALAYIIYMLILIKTGFINLSDEYLEYHDRFASKKISLKDISVIDVISGLTIIRYGDKKTINLRPCLFNPKGLQNELMSRFNTSQIENYIFVKKHYVKLKKESTSNEKQ